MKKILKMLDNMEENILSLLLPIMCIVIFVATFCRYTKIVTISWAEEFARYCMVWIIFLGISVAAKKGEHFFVSALVFALPKKIQNIVAILKIVLLMGFNGFVGFYCIKIIENQMMMEQVTPSLKWPMWIIYMAIPIGLSLMAIRYMIHTIGEIRAYTKIAGKEETL